MGKTSILNQFALKTFSQHYKATIGADFLEKEVTVDGETVSLQIWDTAGQERFQSLGVSFYRGADGCVLVYDLTATTSFESVAQWREEFMSQAALRDPAHFPIVLLGNKADLRDQRRVREGIAAQWCREKGDLSHYEVSAKDNFGLEEAFLDLTRRALAQQSKDPGYTPSVDLRESKARKTGCCGRRT